MVSSIVDTTILFFTLLAAPDRTAVHSNLPSDGQNTAGLDPRERLRLRQYISDLAQDRIVFLTTHIVSDIESIAGDVLLMKQGELVRYGAPEELIASCGGKDLEDVYMTWLGVD